MDEKNSKNLEELTNIILDIKKLHKKIFKK